MNKWIRLITLNWQQKVCVLGLFLVVGNQSIMAAEYYIDEIYNADQISRGQVEGYTSGSQSIWENPANLGSVKALSLSWYSASHMGQETAYNNYTLGYRSPLGVIALGYYEVRIGDIEHNILVNDQAETVSLYAFKNSILKCSIQQSLTDQLHVGGTATRYDYSGYSVTGVGYSSDLGIKYRTDLDWLFVDNLDFSVSYKNWLRRHVYYTNGRSEQIPSSVVVSTGIQLLNEFECFVQKTVTQRNENSLYYDLNCVGLRYRPSLFGKKIMSLSIGRSESLLPTNKIDSTYALGMGLELVGFGIHVAYQPNQYSYDQYYYTVTLNL